MSRAVIEREIPHPENGRAGILVRSPYHEAFILDLKNIEPPGDRRWCGEEFNRKAWWVAEDHLDYVADLCCHYFGGVMVVGGEGGDVYRDASGVQSRQEGLFS